MRRACKLRTPGGEAACTRGAKKRRVATRRPPARRGAALQEVAAFLVRAVDLCIEVQAARGKALKDFLAGLEGHAGIAALRADVEAFAARFPMPGYNVALLSV